MPVEVSEVVTSDLEGAASNTFKVEVAVLPVPPFVEETLPVVLMYAPAAATLTDAATVQLPLGMIDPPARVIVFPPDVPLTVPPHCGEATSAARITPPGKVSVNATPVRTVLVFGFVMVSSSVDVPPATIGFGENDFEMEGGAITVTVSVPVLFVSFVSVILLFGSTVAVFARLPAEAGVTLKVTTKLPPIPIPAEPPFAIQESVPAEIVQLILAEFVMLTKVPTVGVPYVGPTGSGSLKMV